MNSHSCWSANQGMLLRIKEEQEEDPYSMMQYSMREHPRVGCWASSAAPMKPAWSHLALPYQQGQKEQDETYPDHPGQQLCGSFVPVSFTNKGNYEGTAMGIQKNLSSTSIARLPGAVQTPSMLDDVQVATSNRPNNTIVTFLGTQAFSETIDGNVADPKYIHDSNHQECSTKGEQSSSSCASSAEEPSKNEETKASTKQKMALKHNKKERKKRESTAESFPTKLHQILENPEFEDVISWMPHGRSWRIFNIKEFEKRVLVHKFFRSVRYTSFLRQINGWGFRRISQGPDSHAYYHVCFVRRMPELCESMRRPQQGENPLEWAESYRYNNPDFYRIHAVAPLPFLLLQQEPPGGVKGHHISEETRETRMKMPNPTIDSSLVSVESNDVQEHIDSRSPTSKASAKLKTHLDTTNSSAIPSGKESDSKLTTTLLRGVSPVPFHSILNSEVEKDGLECDCSVMSFWDQEHHQFQDMFDADHIPSIQQEENIHDIVTDISSSQKENANDYILSFFNDAKTCISDNAKGWEEEEKPVLGGTQPDASSHPAVPGSISVPNIQDRPSVCLPSNSPSITTMPVLSKTDLSYLAYQNRLLQQQTYRLKAERCS